MAKETPSRADTVAFVAKLLKANPEIPFSEVRKKAKDSGYHVYPLIAGLARKELGWAPSAKAKTGRPAGRRGGRGRGRPAEGDVGAAPRNGRRGPGRPRKMQSMGGDIAGALQALEREIGAMREALRTIAETASRF
ncbi:MAG TPA: hypothetical protein VEI02_02855 [Planctomycetota bacterium]|nr:hypothetical protein [Planctomycetota bacterium]